MKQEAIEYSDLIDLGFTREDSDDSTFFSEYGFGYFLVYLNLKKGISFDWCINNRTVRMLRCDKQGNILGEHLIKDLDELKKWIKFFSK